LAVGCGADEHGRATRTFTRAGVLRIANEFGLDTEEAGNIYNEMREIVARHWKDEFKASGFSEAETETFEAAFREPGPESQESKK
jgi:hypothetical protein